MSSKKKSTAPVFVLWDEPERFVPQTPGNLALPESDRVGYDLLPYSQAELKRTLAQIAFLRNGDEERVGAAISDEEAEEIAQEKLWCLQVRGIHNLRVRGSDGEVVEVSEPRVVWNAHNPELVLQVAAVSRRLRDMGAVDPNS